MHLNRMYFPVLSSKLTVCFPSKLNVRRNNEKPFVDVLRFFDIHLPEEIEENCTSHSGMHENDHAFI